PGPTRGLAARSKLVRRARETMNEWRVSRTELASQPWVYTCGNAPAEVPSVADGGGVHPSATRAVAAVVDGRSGAAAFDRVRRNATGRSRRARSRSYRPVAARAAAAGESASGRAGGARAWRGARGAARRDGGARAL